MNKQSITVVLSSIALIVGTQAASAIDIAPADYVALPAGTNLGMIYGQISSSSKLNLEGVGNIPRSQLGVGVGLLRYVRYEKLGSMPVSVQAILPFGGFTSAKIGGAEVPKHGGLGDLTLGATIYPIATKDPNYGTTVGLTMFTTFPTGNFATTGVSLGSGTYTITPQIGVIQGLGNGFYFDGALDAAFEAKHSKDGLRYRRDGSIQGQAYLRYQFSKATSVSFGYSGRFEGKQYINGTYTGLKTRSDQLRVFANTFLTQSTQIQGMIGTDLNASGTFKQSIVGQVRLMQVF